MSLAKLSDALLGRLVPTVKAQACTMGYFWRAYCVSRRLMMCRFYMDYYSHVSS